MRDKCQFSQLEAWKFCQEVLGHTKLNSEIFINIETLSRVCPILRLGNMGTGSGVAENKIF